MWKDFFYFSKGQRTAIVVLICLIIITIAIEFLLPYFIPQKEQSKSDFFDEAKRFEQSLVSRDSLRRAQWEQKYDSIFQNDKEFVKKEAEKYSLFKFDPNTVDSATFVRLGLKPFIASNILKFRSKGGKFRTAESFSKVYGIYPEKFKELEPYIAIAEIKQTTKDSIKTSSTTKIKSIIVELNSADTTELMKVYGLGRGYAKAIVRFRQQTGGFVSVEQLRELYGMSEDNFNKISPNCKVNTELVKKIQINTASVERLNAHPYLNFYESKAIYEFRRRKGKLKNANELAAISELKPETIRKIQPYFSFE
jgi:competence ComEA-like helix-hairpin-helix protein